MKRLAILGAALALAGCATAGTVRLNADKALLTAQVALKSAQQTTLAACQVPAAPVAACTSAIDLLHEGARYEAAAVAAQQAGASIDEAAAVANLTNLLAQISALGLTRED